MGRQVGRQETARTGGVFFARCRLRQRRQARAVNGNRQNPHIPGRPPVAEAEAVKCGPRLLLQKNPPSYHLGAAPFAAFRPVLPYVFLDAIEEIIYNQDPPLSIYLAIIIFRPK
jgi:hypothetical protein